jgi:hypothetical protein
MEYVDSALQATFISIPTKAVNYQTDVRLMLSWLTEPVNVCLPLETLQASANNVHHLLCLMSSAKHASWSVREERCS